MPKLMLNQVDNTYGRLTVISYAGAGKWLCKCLCGKSTTVRNYYFKQIKYPTCGSCKTQQTYPLEYKTYDSMLQRCGNPNSPDYPRYGGRGITVDPRWKQDFYYFLEDMGRRPSIQYTLDRKDNNGNYTKDNCRWATKLEQANNTRLTHVFDINNIIYTPNGYYK